MVVGTCTGGTSRDAAEARVFGKVVLLASSYTGTMTTFAWAVNSSVAAGKIGDASGVGLFGWRRKVESRSLVEEAGFEQIFSPEKCGAELGMVDAKVARSPVSIVGRLAFLGFLPK